MSPEALQRLRRRLTAYVAFALGVAIAVPSATLCVLRADRAEERFDARVAGAVRDVDAVLFEEGGQLNVRPELLRAASRRSWPTLPTNCARHGRSSEAVPSRLCGTAPGQKTCAS